VLLCCCKGQMSLEAKFPPGRAVKVKPTVKDHGQKLGRIRGVGTQLGHPVVRVKLDESEKPVAFAPEELQLL